VATTVEELRVKVTADTKGAEEGLDRVDDKAGKSGKGFSAAKAAVVGFGVAGVASLAGGLIGAASDLNETVSKTGVVFGKQTDQVTGYAQKMADDFGLPKTAVLDAASSFGLLGSAAGLSGKPLADMSTGLTSLAADAMSFYNVPLEQALGDFTSALSGESEPVKKYGILMNEAAVQAEALALGIAKPVKNTKALADAQLGVKIATEAYNKAVKDHGVKSLEAEKAQNALGKANDKVAAAAKGTVGPLTEAQKVQARTSLITKGLSKAHGDLERTQSSVSNQAKMLQGRIQNLAADFGAKMLPAASAVLGVLIDLASNVPAVTGFLADNGRTIGIVAGIIGAILLPRLIAWGVQSTIAAAKSVAAWVTTQAAAIRSSYAQMGAALRVVAGWVMSGAAAVKSGAQTVAIWALYKAEAIKGAAVWVAQQARIVASTVASAAVQAATMAATVARTVAGWVLMGAQSLIQAARMAAAWFIALGPVGWVIAAVVGLAILIYKNWDTIVAATKKAWTAISNWVKSAWVWIKNAVKSALTFVANLMTLQFRVMLAVAKTVWNGIKSAISTVLSFIRTVITTYVNTYKAVVSAAWNWIKSVTTSAWNGIKTAVSRAISGLIGVVRGIPGKIKSALSGLGTLLWNSGQRIMQGLADGIWQGLGRVTGAVRGVLQKARNLLPFSPAKEGPFSGRGWTLHSGRSISAALAQGMWDNARDVRKAALGMAQAAVPRLGSLSVPGASLGALRSTSGSQDGSGPLRPSQMADTGQRGPTTVVHQVINYPVAEKTSVATNRGLPRVSSLPLGG
jgi:hypothetical protein